MNCKQGDLAVIVRSSAGNEYKIVRCLRFIPRLLQLGRNGRVMETPCWEIDTPLRGFLGTIDCFISDSQLRPLRDSDGEDEMLRLAGRPVGAAQDA